MAQKNFLMLPTAQDFLQGVGGKEAFELVRICNNSKKEVTDEEIGKKLPLKITEIRAILNRLHYRGIACYQKTRNQNSGWYNYTWSIKMRRIAELLLEQQAEEIQKLERKRKFEKSYALFSCLKGCNTVPFEIAAEYQFSCPECNQPMNTVDSKKMARDTVKRINQLKKEVKIIEKTLKKTQKLGQKTQPC